jgi:hypothetical protein
MASSREGNVEYKTKILYVGEGEISEDKRIHEMAREK